MKKTIAIILLLAVSAAGFGDNEISMAHTTGQTCYCVVEQVSDTKVWDGDSFETSPAWTDADISYSEHALILGKYTATMPASISAGLVNIHSYEQVGASPANTDTYIKGQQFYWTGTYLLDASAVLTVEAIDASTYIESRTLAAADYFDSASDAVDAGSFSSTAATAIADIPTVSEFEARSIVAADLSSIFSYTTTAIPNTLSAIQTTVGYIVEDTGTSGVVIADGGITAAKIATNAITDDKIAADAIGSSELATTAISEIQSGLATAANITSAHSTTDGKIDALNDFNPASDTVANVTTVASITNAVTTDEASRTASKADVSALATAAALTTVEGKVDTIDTNVDSILEDTGTTLPASIATAQTDLDTITDNGVDLKATGLDNIPVTEVDGVADTFREMIVQLWQRFFYKITATSTAITTYKDDETTVNTTQTVSDDGTTQIVGEAE